MNFLEENIRNVIITLIWALHLWELYLSSRQRKLMKKNDNIPTSVDNFMTKDVYDKARLYALDKNSFSVFKDWYSTILNTLYIVFNALYYYWYWGAELVAFFGISKENDILVSAGCVFLMNVVTIITEMPLVVYDTFVLEEKHGFNKQTPLFFIRDQALKFVVSQIFLLPFLCGIVWIVKNGGDLFFFYLWIFTVIVTIFMMIIYPEVIAPLFDKYSPLPEGELKNKIEALAASLNFPLYKLYIVEGSKRSSHSNAYMYGFHKNKRIVLFDTLVKEYYKPKDEDSQKDYGCETDEVLAVLAHELGHWKYSHTLKGFLLAQVSFVFNFVAFSKLLHYTPMYTAFGFEDSKPIFIGLIIVTMYILIPFNTLMSFLLTVNSRRFEFQADNFAKQLGHTDALKRALIKLQKDNLGYPIHDSLYSGWHHSHPPLLQRLEALNKSE